MSIRFLKNHYKKKNFYWTFSKEKVLVLGLLNCQKEYFEFDHSVYSCEWLNSNVLESHLLFFLFNVCSHFVCLCDFILYTWFAKKWKQLNKFWGWKICLIYAYFFKHPSISMLISFMLIKNNFLFLPNDELFD